MTPLIRLKGHPLASEIIRMYGRGMTGWQIKSALRLSVQEAERLGLIEVEGERDVYRNDPRNR